MDVEDRKLPTMLACEGCMFSAILVCMNSILTWLLYKTENGIFIYYYWKENLEVGHQCVHIPLFTISFLVGLYLDQYSWHKWPTHSAYRSLAGKLTEFFNFHINTLIQDFQSVNPHTFYIWINHLKTVVCITLQCWARALFSSFPKASMSKLVTSKK